jgi:predicted Holliday junction resolvase-like endonuclease
VASLKDFQRRIKKVADGVETKSNDNIIKMAVIIDQVVTIGTPVDTGHARANWQATIAVETVEVLNETDQSGAGAIAKARAVIEGRKTEQTIHITNNVKYVPRLNEGSSAQAPAQFVQKAVNTALNAFRGMKLL